MNLISLESEFSSACSRHDHLKLLESQWRFDKELISKALQNISSSFSNYSRHDASHSRQIIINIERMLGEKIKHLTATDMWLILESAYCHDIGMVITHKQIEDLDTQEFQSFISDISAQPEHDLHDFAKNWFSDEAKLPLGSDAHIFFNEYKQVLAEWFRGKHPVNSSKIISNPYEQIGLTSPRNELLPQRLFNSLALICEAHGQHFDKVMTLPFSEAGMATEDCHPRYVAFLLRMADLLDVDDNRFCPVMMRLAGPKLPHSSHIHLEKHQGIKHFRLDPERIKIEVSCPSPESYAVAHDWFSWLEKEYHQQSQHWTKIVPNEQLGRLPTLSPPKVTIQDPFVIINEGKVPDFHLNSPAILKILRGTGLYSSDTDCIREVLQNAVDSSILAIWSSHREEIKDLNPTSESVIEIFKKYSISIDLQPSDKGDNFLKLTITDSGMGLSSENIRQMLCVGRSNKPTSKTRLIESMPEWLKPSGNFGIGLQSIKLLSPNFHFKTRSRETNEAYLINFNLDSKSPVVIQKINHNGVTYGAEICIEIPVSHFPDNITFPHPVSAHEFQKQLLKYDFTKKGSDLRFYQEYKILESISTFAEFSPIHIKNSIFKPRAQTGLWYPRRNIIIHKVDFGYSDNCSAHLFFRGQPIGTSQYFFKLISISIDFYGHQAIDFITYNREKILQSAQLVAREEAIEAALHYIDTEFYAINEDKKPLAAAFYYLYQQDNQLRSKYKSQLLKYKIHLTDDTDLELGFLIDKINDESITNVVLDTGASQFNGSASIPTFTHDRNDTIHLKSGSPSVTLDLINVACTENGMYWQEILPTDGVLRASWHKEPCFPVDQAVLKKILSSQNRYMPIGNRILFPSWGEYRKLSVKRNIHWHTAHPHIQYENDTLVLPCKILSGHSYEIAIDDSLLSWVCENLKYDAMSIPDIKNLYLSLIQEIESHLQPRTNNSSDNS